MVQTNDSADRKSKTTVPDTFYRSRSLDFWKRCSYWPSAGLFSRVAVAAAPTVKRLREIDSRRRTMPACTAPQIDRGLPRGRLALQGLQPGRQVAGEFAGANSNCACGRSWRPIRDFRKQNANVIGHHGPFPLFTDSQRWVAHGASSSRIILVARSSSLGDP